jgi:methylmalonyl-CoA mutase N-terminal domain/subunit
VTEVGRVAGTDGNLLPPLRDALAVRATIGELCEALRELWGTYDAR